MERNSIGAKLRYIATDSIVETIWCPIGKHAKMHSYQFELSPTLLLVSSKDQRYSSAIVEHILTRIHHFKQSCQMSCWWPQIHWLIMRHQLPFWLMRLSITSVNCEEQLVLVDRIGVQTRCVKWITVRSFQSSNISRFTSRDNSWKLYSKAVCPLFKEDLVVEDKTSSTCSPDRERFLVYRSWLLWLYTCTIKFSITAVRLYPFVRWCALQQAFSYLRIFMMLKIFILAGFCSECHIMWICRDSLWFSLVRIMACGQNNWEGF